MSSITRLLIFQPTQFSGKSQGRLVVANLQGRTQTLKHFLASTGNLDSRVDKTGQGANVGEWILLSHCRFANR
jgi:hypothetical protein